MSTKKENKKGLRTQIMGGYLKIIALSCVLGIITIILLGVLSVYYNSVANMDEERMQIANAITQHYTWRSDLVNSLQTNSSFSGSLDPTTCSCGQILAQKSQEKMLPEVESILNNITSAHDSMHSLAEDLLSKQSTTDKDTLVDEFYASVSPLTTDVIDALREIDSIYAQEVESAKQVFETLLAVTIAIIVLVMIMLVVFSTIYANRLAHQVSYPITRIANWANRLSLGSVDFNIDEEFEKMQRINADNEVGMMIEAFCSMAKNIKENVEVVRRVADGDMTAFVNIRSHHDSLGKSLYRLVQSNDAMFGEIIKSARTVAAGANEIANASHLLAESTTAQAAAANELSHEMENVSRLINFNDEKAQTAYKIVKDIEEDIKTNNAHMEVLVDSVVHMHDASQKIAVVMKTIDDIAFETNILALNAAIEAARAGVAGKGFAVVADEVRALALKSTEAAKESRALIENSITQTQKGSEIATESATIFEEINKKIKQIVEIVEEVSGLSSEQFESVRIVSQSVTKITEAATSNAAISEQSDASSHEMSQQAEFLRDAMKHFNLRMREEGKAYIPYEKKDDDEFIKHANEALQLKENTGHFGYEYIDPYGQQIESSIFDLDNIDNNN